MTASGRTTKHDSTGSGAGGNGTSGVSQQPDVDHFCPNCGVVGEVRKCKVVCANPKCHVQIILACVD